MTVDYATSDLTAQDGADYTAASGTLTFNAGTHVQTITVPILDDSDPGQTTHTVRVPITDDAAPVAPAPLELPETFWMTLSTRSGSVATPGRAHGLAVIVDDDAPA